MAKPTKQYIADKALLLFNERGYASVRLQHIADTAFVSVGHLAYHFQNKKGLLDHLFDAMTGEKKQILLEHKTLPLFEDLQQLWIDLLQHQLRFRFLYTDALEDVRTAELYPIERCHTLSNYLAASWLAGNPADGFHLARYNDMVAKAIELLEITSDPTLQAEAQQQLLDLQTLYDQAHPANESTPTDN